MVRSRPSRRAGERYDDDYDDRKDAGREVVCRAGEVHESGQEKTPPVAKVKAAGGIV